MTVLGIIGIIAAFCLLMYMIMKGFNIYLTVFVCTLVVALTSQMNVYEAYKVHFRDHPKFCVNLRCGVE